MELETYDDRPTQTAWISIELLAYTFTKVLVGTGLRVVSSSPFLNGFGDSMSFVVEGNENPDEVAQNLRNILKEFDQCQEE